MPTMPERMAIVETKVSAIDTRTDRTDKKVDRLIDWMNEERGAKDERERNARKNKTLFGAAMTLLGALGGAIFNAVRGGG